jgi:SAM-dependent methyltransferase
MQVKFQMPALKAFYEAPVNDQRKLWRKIGAEDKADNIADAIKSAGLHGHIGAVLEVGAGTGAVLDSLAHRASISDITGLEIGPPPGTRSEGGHIILHYGGREIPFPDQSFDLVYATHVLEHVVDERFFLSELRRVARKLIYVEVPCELTIRATVQALQKSLDIGHINAYSPVSFRLRLETSGLTVKEFIVRDVSLQSKAFGQPVPKAVVLHAIRRAALWLSPKMAPRIFTYHVGALCERASYLDIAE